MMCGDGTRHRLSRVPGSGTGTPHRHAEPAQTSALPIVVMSYRRQKSLRALS